SHSSSPSTDCAQIPKGISSCSTVSGICRQIQSIPILSHRSSSTRIWLPRTIRATLTPHDCFTTERSRMLCVRPDRPVNPIALSVMRAVDTVAKELGLSYCLVGALARDVLLGHVF